MHLLASEGGWQAFTLAGTDKALLIIALLVALAALGVSYILTKDVLAAPSGDEEMEKIAGAVQEGAMAYITRQFRTIAIIVIPLAIVVFLTSSTIKKETGDGRPRLRRLGLLPDARLPRRRRGIGLHRLPRHVAGHARQRPHHGGRDEERLRRAPSRSPSAPAAPSAWPPPASASPAPR